MKDDLSKLEPLLPPEFRYVFTECLKTPEVSDNYDYDVLDINIYASPDIRVEYIDFLVDPSDVLSSLANVISFSKLDNNMYRVVFRVDTREAQKQCE